MARPVPRRRSAPDEVPTADRYSRRSVAAEEEPEVERRPSRTRGELPAAPARRRGRTPEPEPEKEPAPRGRRSRRSEPTPAEVLDELGIDDVELLQEMTDEDLVTLAGKLGVATEDADGDMDVDDFFDELAEKATEVLEGEPEPEPAPRGRRGRAAEPEEETPARGRRARRSESEEEKPASRGRRSRAAAEDDEDEAPARTARKGFKGFQKTREATSNFDDFRLTDEEVLVKFLEDEPYATYAEHGLYRELNDGQRVWICLRPDEACPICDTGHNPRAIALWNVVVIPAEGEPQLKSLKAGPALEKILEAKSSLKTGPLSKEYYSMSQLAGKNDGPVVYNVELVRERDVKEDWQEEPFTAAEVKAFKKNMPDETSVKYPSRKQLREIAEKLSDD